MLCFLILQAPAFVWDMNLALVRMAFLLVSISLVIVIGVLVGNWIQDQRY